MRKSRKSQSIAADPGTRPDAPARLAEAWQAAGREWANWWLRAASGATSDEKLPGSVRNIDRALPTTPSAWISPEALAEIAGRYQQKFETLWSRVALGG